MEQQTAAGIKFYYNPTTHEAQWSPRKERNEASDRAIASTTAAATGRSGVIAGEGDISQMAPSSSVGNMFDDGGERGTREGSGDARLVGENKDSYHDGNSGLPDHIEVRVSEDAHNSPGAT